MSMNNNMSMKGYRSDMSGTVLLGDDYPTPQPFRVGKASSRQFCVISKKIVIFIVVKMNIKVQSIRSPVGEMMSWTLWLDSLV